ncbi:MAG: phosphate ABC transporter permease PstA [Eubacterium aggregans]|uniref:phosphate ABC transporter permease PstA n=1 Tax=Eubacterium aggregans TaxID=81409 RepID=UPI0023F3BEBF|nr:phosphate ABC transporter permease PstA [Eubacterium aggregans]MDD4691439.1 phosphate ABC transporter permease PstA [Eubacterium aggregans]MEA5073507.1 phosphate ABC transporter permease PstA [Eubacterium aggregans]
MTQSSKIQAKVLKGLVWFGAIMTIGILAFLVLYILIMGVPNLSLDLFAFKYTTENVSLFPALVNTIIMIAVTLIIAVPLGIGSAIFLEEYAKRGNPLVKLVAITTETLSGIPSIVYGIFGMLFFVTTLGWGYSMLAGSCTLAIMILPLIMRTTQEALKAVPDTYREGSFGLGAGRLRTVFRIILPAASPGIFAGIVLAVGRIVGETAALIYTAGTVAQIPPNLMGSGRTLAIHMYALWSEGLNTGQSYATAVVLLVIVILLNLLSDKIAQKIASGGN